MHHIFAPNFPITGITVRLQDACKFPKELPGALSATIQVKIEHYRSARSAILAEISLVILALGSFGLHIDGRFIGLNVTTAQKFPAHCPNDSHEQFTDSHDPTTERDSGKLQSSFPFQHRALTKQRHVIAVFTLSASFSLAPYPQLLSLSGSHRQLARPLRMQVCDTLRRVDSLAQLAAVPAKALKLEILNSGPHNNLVDLNVAGLFDGICYRSGNGVGRDCDLIEVLHIL